MINCIQIHNSGKQYIIKDIYIIINLTICQINQMLVTINLQVFLMSGSKIQSTKSKINILQAEGQLNRSIQSALQTFRSKLSEQINPCIPCEQNQQYETSKSGPQKVFKFRQSLMTIMFKIKDIKTIYNMVIASFIMLTFTLIYSNYYQYNELFDHQQLSQMFTGLNKVLFYWLFLTLIHYSIIPITKISLRLPKIIWIPLYLFHLCSIMGFAMIVSDSDDIGFASVLIIMIEATRMVLKSHSYFRTKMLYLTDNQYKNYVFQNIKVVNIQQNKRKSNHQIKQSSVKQNVIQHTISIKNNDMFTQIKNLSYFFVAPTIMYRDKYTLTPIRSMGNIIGNAINFLACIYYSFMLYIFMCKSVIANLQNKLDFSTFLITVIKLMLPSVFFLLLGFFGFLHSWLNCWAQITRFPDKCFYSDWWNSIQFGSYYRKWNIIVHDWLYYYIYIDFSRFTSKYKFPRVVPKLMTFIISAIIHQVIITYALGFFYPILFLLFTGPGIILIQNTKNLKSISVNLAFWIQMYIGSSLLFTFYLVQSFSRKIITNQFMIAQWGSMATFIPRTIYLGENI